MEIKFKRDKLEQMQNGVCPYCLRLGFKNTLAHIVQKHHITNIEVREDFGINHFEPLCTPEMSKIYSQRKMSEKTLAALRHGRENQPKTHRPFAPQGQISRAAWLSSERHKEIAVAAMSTQEARKNLRQWAATAYLKRKRLPNGTFAGVLG